jgi:hypothetical protein
MGKWANFTVLQLMEITYAEQFVREGIFAQNFSN